MSNTIGFDAQLDRDGFLDGWRMNAYYQHGNNEQNFDTDNGIRVDRIPLALDAVAGPGRAARLLRGAREPGRLRRLRADEHLRRLAEPHAGGA